MATFKVKVFPRRSIWDTQAYNVFDIQNWGFRVLLQSLLICCNNFYGPMIPDLMNLKSMDCGEEIDGPQMVSAVDAVFG